MMFADWMGETHGDTDTSHVQSTLEEMQEISKEAIQGEIQEVNKATEESQETVREIGTEGLDLEASSRDAQIPMGVASEVIREETASGDVHEIRTEATELEAASKDVQIPIGATSAVIHEATLPGYVHEIGTEAAELEGASEDVQKATDTVPEVIHEATASRDAHEAIQPINEVEELGGLSSGPTVVRHARKNRRHRQNRKRCPRLPGTFFLYEDASCTFA
jgi:hypothetical protein